MNASLYFLVFGESLFNDGVSVVLYNSMLALVNQSVDVTQILLCVASFFFVVFGGLLIGFRIPFEIETLTHISIRNDFWGFGELLDNSNRACSSLRTSPHLLQRLHGLRCGRTLSLVCLTHGQHIVHRICVELFVQVWHHQHHWLWLSRKTVEIKIIFCQTYQRSEQDLVK